MTTEPNANSFETLLASLSPDHKVSRAVIEDARDGAVDGITTPTQMMPTLLVAIMTLETRLLALEKGAGGTTHLGVDSNGHYIAVQD